MKSELILFYTAGSTENNFLLSFKKTLLRNPGSFDKKQKEYGNSINFNIVGPASWKPIIEHREKFTSKENNLGITLFMDIKDLIKIINLISVDKMILVDHKITLI